jgi:hypothetical protein
MILENNGLAPYLVAQADAAAMRVGNIHDDETRDVAPIAYAHAGLGPVDFRRLADGHALAYGNIAVYGDTWREASSALRICC